MENENNTTITYRKEEINDVMQIQVVRHLVKEIVLSNPALVQDSDVAYYITDKGRG